MVIGKQFGFETAFKLVARGLRFSGFLLVLSKERKCFLVRWYFIQKIALPNERHRTVVDDQLVPN